MPWGGFLENAEKTWLSYGGGDKLKACGDELRGLVQALVQAHEVFGDACSKEQHDAYLKCKLQIDALVFCVKTVRGLEKAGEGLKRQRFARNQLKKTKATDFGSALVFVPEVMLARLASESGNTMTA